MHEDGHARSHQFIITYTGSVPYHINLSSKTGDTIPYRNRLTTNTRAGSCHITRVCHPIQGDPINLTLNTRGSGGNIPNHNNLSSDTRWTMSYHNSFSSSTRRAYRIAMVCVIEYKGGILYNINFFLHM